MHFRDKIVVKGQELEVSTIDSLSSPMVRHGFETVVFNDTTHRSQTVWVSVPGDGMLDHHHEVIRQLEVGMIDPTQIGVFDE